MSETPESRNTHDVNVNDRFSTFYFGTSLKLTDGPLYSGHGSFTLFLDQIPKLEGGLTELVVHWPPGSKTLYRQISD